TLARAHARSADPAVLTGYMGKNDAMDDALASFAMAYAARTQSDYDRLAKAKRPATKQRCRAGTLPDSKGGFDDWSTVLALRLAGRRRRRLRYVCVSRSRRDALVQGGSQSQRGSAAERQQRHGHGDRTLRHRQQEAHLEGQLFRAVGAGHDGPLPRAGGTRQERRRRRADHAEHEPVRKFGQSD